MVTHTTSLVALFGATAEGNLQAWGELCDAIRGDLLRVASRLCRDAEMGEDVAQDSLLAIREAAPRVWAGTTWTEQAVLRYCKAIAAHRAIKARQRADRQVVFDGSCHAPKIGGHPEEPLMHRELACLIREGLAEVREPFAEAITLHHLGGLSQQEVAIQQGVSHATVRTRLWRGLRQLKQALRRRGVRASTLMVLVAMGDLRAETGLVAPVMPITTICSQGALIMTTFCTGVLGATAILIAFTGGEIRAAEGDQEGVETEIPAQQSSTVGVLPDGRIVTFEKDPQTGALISDDGIRVTKGRDGKLQAIKEPTGREGSIIVRNGVEYLQFKDAEGKVIETALSQHPRRVIIGELDVTQALADGHCSLPMLRGILAKANKPLAKNFDNAAFTEWDGSLPAGFDIEVAKRLDHIKESGLKIQAAQGEDGGLLLHWLTSTRNDRGHLVIGNNIYLIDPSGGFELIEAPITNA